MWEITQSISTTFLSPTRNAEEDPTRWGDGMVGRTLHLLESGLLILEYHLPTTLVAWHPRDPQPRGLRNSGRARGSVPFPAPRRPSQGRELRGCRPAVPPPPRCSPTLTEPTASTSPPVPGPGLPSRPITPGASNHSVSISLTPFIPLKTHLKTLGPRVCSGLYPH